MIKFRAAVATVVAASLGIVAPAGAAVHRDTLTQAQQALEAQLAMRQTQLGKLTADVTAATNLAPQVAMTLDASLATETTNIDFLVAKVPTDATFAELKVDETTMIRDNRVYAVMTPQVRDSISAANDTANANEIQNEEANLGSEIQARKGDAGWVSAWKEFQHMTIFAADAKVNVSGVTQLVLIQTPQGFPANEHAFVQADQGLLRGAIDLAYASYDRSVIELFVDGYGAVSSRAASTASTSIS